MISMTGNRNSTRFGDDAVHRKTREFDPPGNQRTWSYDAEANIMRRVDGNGAITDYQWVGGEGYYLNQDIGLHLLGLRHYSAALGRFMTRDALGHVDDANLYSYVSNNPVNAIDPSGMFSYGKYCGYSNKALQSDCWAGIWGPGREPIDCYDQACFNHDCCVGTWSFGAICRWLFFCDDAEVCMRSKFRAGHTDGEAAVGAMKWPVKLSQISHLKWVISCIQNGSRLVHGDSSLVCDGS